MYVVLGVSRSGSYQWTASAAAHSEASPWQVRCAIATGLERLDEKVHSAGSPKSRSSSPTLTEKPRKGDGSMAYTSMARWVNPGSDGVDGVLRRANDQLSLDARRRGQLRRIVFDSNEAQQALLTELSTDPPLAGARRNEIIVELKHTWRARNDQLAQVLSEEELRVFTTIEAEEARPAPMPAPKTDARVPIHMHPHSQPRAARSLRQHRCQHGGAGGSRERRGRSRMGLSATGRTGTSDSRKCPPSSDRRRRQPAAGAAPAACRTVRSAA